MGRWESTDTDIFQHFCTAGITPKSVADPFNKNKSRSKGWTTVECHSLDDAQHAIEVLNESSLGDRKISVRFDAKAM